VRPSPANPPPQPFLALFYCGSSGLSLVGLQVCPDAGQNQCGHAPSKPGSGGGLRALRYTGPFKAALRMPIMPSAGLPAAIARPSDFFFPAAPDCITPTLKGLLWRPPIETVKHGHGGAPDME
jgi:hypothetical protein